MTPRIRFIRQALLLAGLVALGATGCIDPEEVVLEGGFEFNPRLRSDIHSLSQEEESAPLRFMSDGRERADDPLSRLMSDLVFEDIPQTRLRRLRRSQAFWILDDPDAQPLLSYEAVITDFGIEGHQVNLDTLGTAGGRFSHPVSREPLRVDGRPSATALSPEATRLTVQLRRCGDGPVRLDPASPPDALDKGCQELDMHQQACPNATGHDTPPYTHLRCPIEPIRDDTSLDLLMADWIHIDGLDVYRPARGASRHVVSDVKVVRGVRQLARSLEPLGFEQDGAYQRHFWQFAVEELADGRWRENFSPELAVAAVRVFVAGDVDPDTGEPERIYLEPWQVDELKIGDGDTHVRCASQSEEGQAASFFLATDCSMPKLVTPAYAHDRMENLLSWRVEFRVLNDGSGGFAEVPPVKPSEALFIEFALVDADASASDAGVHLDPPVADLGVVRRGEPLRFDEVFELVNDSGGSIRIEAIHPAAFEAEDFQAVPQPLPLTLAAGASLPIDLWLIDGPEGPRSAEVRIVGTAGKQPFEVRAGLLARQAEASEIAVSPRARAFVWAGKGTDPKVVTQTFTIHNPGSEPLTRYGVDRFGPEGPAWKLLGSDAGGGYQTPPPATRVIPPGGSETFLIRFDPIHAGYHEAWVQIPSDASFEPARVDLFGMCYQDC